MQPIASTAILMRGVCRSSNGQFNGLTGVEAYLHRYPSDIGVWPNQTRI
jgi:hypothetical protein